MVADSRNRSQRRGLESSRPRGARHARQHTRVAAIAVSERDGKAIGDLLRELPRDHGLVLIVTARGRLRPPRLRANLARFTSTPVLAGKHGMPIEPDHIYVVPPEMILRHGRLQDRVTASRRRIEHPLDALFSSVAQEAGSCAVGVMLTGANGDGAAGLRAIRAVGGAVVVPRRGEGTTGSTATFRRALGLPGPGPELDLDEIERPISRAPADDEASAMLRAIPVPLVVLDDQLSIRSANPAYHERFGVDPAETIGRAWLETCGRAWDSPALRVALESLLSNGGDIELEVEVEWPRGTRRDVAVAACVLRRSADAPVLLVTPIDVTDRNKLLHAAEEARSQAERANRAKNVFLAMLSHELRAPLHAIMLHADLLAATAVTDPRRCARSADAIARAAKAQARIIGDLLDVSAIIAGKMAIRRQPVQLQTAIAAALDSIRERAAGKHIHLRVDIDPSVGAVRGDEARLQQIVANLLTNAVKFTPEEGEVSVSLDRDDGGARIRVSDTGRGIEPELMTQVFERFVQGSSSNDPSKGGLGLGLAIVHDLVGLHGGTVRAESDGPGRGATFTVVLPLLATNEESAVDEETDPRGHDAGEIAPLAASAARRELDGVKIILVDDDDGCRDVFSEILRLHGAAVEAVQRPADVLPIMSRFRPDVLLCDIAMPEEDGYHLIRRIRDLPPEDGGRVAAVAVTALATRNDRRRALSAGFQLHVAKPAPAAVLVDAVRRARTVAVPATARSSS